MDRQHKDHRPVLDTAGVVLGTSRIEMIPAPPSFGQVVPAKLHALDFDAGALHANDKIVIACSEVCQPLCTVLATLQDQGADTSDTVYVLVGPTVPGHPRFCSAREECNLLA